VDPHLTRHLRTRVPRPGALELDGAASVKQQTSAARRVRSKPAASQPAGSDRAPFRVRGPEPECEKSIARAAASGPFHIREIIEPMLMMLKRRFVDTHLVVKTNSQSTT
jgi:hypothetical protein